MDYLVMTSSPPPLKILQKVNFEKDNGLFKAILKNQKREQIYDIKRLFFQEHVPRSSFGIRASNFIPKAVFFDFDSTIIEEESMTVLANRIHPKNDISKITELAMAGRLSFKQSLEKRLLSLKGVKKNVK